jgi:hypothetical protein
MKTRILIIFLLALSLLAAFCSQAQTKTDSTKQLIADETWATQLKTGAKIITYSEGVFKAISLKFGEQFRSIHIYYKNDRNGPYKEYCIYLTQELANNIKDWAKTNL